MIGELAPTEREAIVLLPAIVKAGAPSGDNRRIVEVSVSSETVDGEGDLILQRALLNSAADFVARGHLDLDHKSELGHLLHIDNPEAYIVGRPLEVWDGGEGQTMMRGVIAQHPDGHSPTLRKSDWFWDTLTCVPPVQWQASVYGFIDPETTIDCRKLAGDACPYGASRFVVSKFDWRSLAFTCNPVNQGIKGYARVVSAKSWLAMNAKAIGFDDKTVRPSMALLDREAGGGCPTCGGLQDRPSLPVWRKHLEKCCGLSADDAELGAHAAMYRQLAKAAKKKLAGNGPIISGPGNRTLADEDMRRSRAGDRYYGRAA